MTLVVCHQPDFAPYLGFFHRLLRADVFIILDDVQFLRRGWHHRDKIKTRNGPEWLTLSVEKAPRETLIKDIKLASDDEGWRSKNLSLLIENYNKAAFFDRLFPLVESIYSINGDSLIDFNLSILELAYKFFDISPKVVFSSSIGVNTKSNQRLIDLVSSVGGTRYLSGTGALDYLDKNMWREAGLDLEIQNFLHPQYTQLHGDFEPYLSCLDLFFNCGPAAADILRS